MNIPITAVYDVQKATENADIIITATPSRQPIIKKEWVKPGTHFSCVGADMQGKQEIDEHIFGVSRVFVDDINQAISVGETEIPYKTAIINTDDIISEIGSVILGETVGRIGNADITIFDSTGISLQDLLTANFILEEARERKIGLVTTL